MPLYSNTTTGNNQLTHTASEQVTSILAYDPPMLTTADYIAYKELSIPLGPRQRVLGNYDIWYDTNSTRDLWMKFRLQKPSDAMNIEKTVVNYNQPANLYLNISASNNIVNNEDQSIDPDHTADLKYLNASIVDTYELSGVAVGDHYFGLNIDDTNSGKLGLHFTMSFKVESLSDSPTDLRLGFNAGGSGTGVDCHIESGSRVTYSKY